MITNESEVKIMRKQKSRKKNHLIEATISAMNLITAMLGLLISIIQLLDD